MVLASEAYSQKASFYEKMSDEERGGSVFRDRFGGLAKVNSGFDYAASFFACSSIA
jgi:hypothetical protein